jgi:branched-chain amino acid transport system ATP-binding protein
MEPILKVENVTKRFGGLIALESVTLAVRSGEVVGLIGPNGAGKTTLFNVISGFVPPTAGLVVFRGEIITGLPPYLIARRGLARTFQIVRPFPDLTVLENLAIGGFTNRFLDIREELAIAFEKAREVADEVGLSPWLERQATALPHGALKRLEIGRAMMLRPSVLLLDEPFAGLGGHEIDEMVEVVSRLARSGVTLIIVEHKLRVLMRLVQRVFVLDFGRLIAEGTPQEVAADPAVQKAYLGEKGVARFA